MKNHGIYCNELIDGRLVVTDNTVSDRPDRIASVLRFAQFEIPGVGIGGSVGIARSIVYTHSDGSASHVFSVEDRRAVYVGRLIECLACHHDVKTKAEELRAFCAAVSALAVA